MTDRYRGYQPASRAATFNNPARASLPASIGYTSLYAGDINVLPSSRHHATPRDYWTTTTAGGVPTTTRTYAVTNDSRSRPTVREPSRTRRSTLDSASRPPVIITTTQKDRTPTASSHSSNARSGSPVRDDYRASDGLFLTQPNSSIRSRSSVRPSYTGTYDDDNYERLRERGDSLLAGRDSDLYRNSRPSVVYPSDPRHNPAVDYGDEGYQYTNAGELARYDLDNSEKRRRRESFDRGYYRPNVNYNADQRSLNVNTGSGYSAGASRTYEGRGGPPPSTRGFDKIPRAYDAPRDVPPATSVAPASASTSQLDIPNRGQESWDTRRPRPVSLYQEAAPRSSHHDDYYRSREDERNMRDLRDRETVREPGRTYDPPHFQDDNVASRGFGIRTGPIDKIDDRREPHREARGDESKRGSDESLPQSKDDRDDRRRDRQDPKREGRREEEEAEEKERSRLRDKVASGLGIAAAAVGLGPLAKDSSSHDKDDKEPRRRRSPDEDRGRRRDAEVPERDVIHEMDREQAKDRGSPREEADLKERYRREAEARLNGDAVGTHSDSDEGRRISRRHRPSNSFNPNDANDLKQLKADLAAATASERTRDRSQPPAAESRKSRSSSATREAKPADVARDDAPSRGRDGAVPSPDEKQVRLVSPPRDKKDEKPLKGILKQPRPAFPEEPNPVREGVAPHKEDKKVKEAPPGAKWTKISRKIVNPEALTIGKERFEVREDFVIVLRVLSKEEIQAYASATQVLRGKSAYRYDGSSPANKPKERRRNGDDGDKSRDRGRDRDRDRDYDRDYEEDSGRRSHRHHRYKEDDNDDTEDRDRDRRRRHRRDDKEDYDSRR
ncbi:hypothetical protein B0I35DRAFT_433258 [Stachybotrys elegans]|uniref:DUF8035 domain-containing protein n=1 Tax=Stachybotrys elegans TaxID=80388 RepID=A0A8K0SJY3_9HYPO|nr:hypothetical protein B0I35DRAFT_433258 [Stachybotrys elegans]